MNELLFFFHTLLTVGFVFLALRLGRSALIVWVAMQGLLANLFVLKQISFFSFTVTCSDVFTIGSLLSLNLLQEYYGKSAAKEAIYLSFLTLLFFACMSQIHLFYTPSPHDTSQAAFTTLLSPSPRILFASLFVFYLVQQLDLRLFARLPGHLSLRATLSLLLSQFLDTIGFSFLGLYGLVASLADVIFISFLIKALLIFLTTPFLLFVKQKVAKDAPL